MGAPENIRKIGSGIDPKNTALTAAVPAAPAGGTGIALGGWSAAADRDIAITAINTNRTRIGEIEAALVAAGLLPA